MAHPIEPTILKSSDFNRLVRDLEHPKPNPKAQKLFELGIIVRQNLLKENV